MALSPSVVTAAASVQFADGMEIVRFFDRIVHQHFIDWFNANCAGRQSWKEKAVGSNDEVKARFVQIWNCIALMFEQPSITLLQFSALMSIFINEAGSDLLPRSELCGRAEYPGLAYAFCAIPSVKQSYNAAGGNKRAGELFFNDDDFWRAHSGRAGADLVRAVPDLCEMWNGSDYPGSLFPTTLDPNHSGFIQQADFFKFRGRGFIQTTWRTNYKRIVEFVQNYSGAHPVLLRYKAAWSAMDADLVCTMSTNDDWDTLFHDTDLIVPCRAVGLHNRAGGNYLALAADAQTLTALSPAAGSLYAAGLRISGSGSYAALFRHRVLQLLETLAYQG
ncbi:MAG: hypothetical protein JOY54_06060 [Acidobacteriaceae bacterium]|nr:hypothetical protein [Acidobacteriaceae bacterium]